MTHIRKLALALILAGFAAPASTAAQVSMSIQMNLPAVLPPLVVVQPGVQVVSDYDREIFFVGGYYWVRNDGYWYRARDPRARWYYVRPNRVPTFLVNAPPGHYRHWHGQGHWKDKERWRADSHRHGHGRGHD
ncbi:MAG TPA: hypothetical protein VFR85_00280 [Anaeromyxobacteraceae bacterium]|nr:hypothetical protein [Anaeromyxobacteraceae bacterium]